MGLDPGLLDVSGHPAGVDVVADAARIDASLERLAARANAIAVGPVGEVGDALQELARGPVGIGVAAARLVRADDLAALRGARGRDRQERPASVADRGDRPPS